MTITFTNPTKSYWTFEKKDFQKSIQEHITRFSRIDDFVVDLNTELNPEMNQKQLADYTIEARKVGGFGAVNMPITFGLKEAAYDLRKKLPDDSLRSFLENSLTNHWLISLTRILNQPKEKDTVIHNYKLPEQEEVKAKIIGPDQWIKESKNKEYLTSVLGTNDVKKINDVFQWINETNAYIWRANSKPSSDDERVAHWVADCDRVVLYCLRFPEFSESSFGVRVREAKN